MSDVKRTIQFQLWLNQFERDALSRVVEARGFRDASEAIRYLIRREDVVLTEILPKDAKEE